MALRARPSLPDLVTWALGLGGVAWIAGTMIRANRIGGADAPHLVSTELRLAQLVLDGEIGLAAHLAWHLIAPHPPFGALPGALLGVISGASPASAHVTMALALAVGFDAFVRISRRVTGGPVAALAAWATLCGSPFLWSAMEQHARDLFAGVAVLQAIAWAASEGGLAVRRNAIGFGVAVAAAFGVKYTGPVFLVGACLVVGARLSWDRDRAAWKGLGIAVGIFACTAGLWYALHAHEVSAYLGNSVDAGAMQGNAASLRDTRTWEAALYYPAALWDAASAPGLAVALLGLAAGLAGRERREATALLAASAIVGVLVLGHVSQQVDRYALPVLFLLSALVIPLARWRIGLVLAVAVAAPRIWWSAWRFAPGKPGMTETFDHPVTTFSAAQYPVAARPWRPSDFDPAQWDLDGIVAALEAAQGPTGTVGLLVPAAPGWPGFGHLSIAAARAGARWDWATINLRVVAAHAPDVFLGPLFSDDWPSPAFEHLVAFEGGGADGGVETWLRRHPMAAVDTIQLPRGGEAVIYRAGGTEAAGAR